LRITCALQPTGFEGIPMTHANLHPQFETHLQRLIDAGRHQAINPSSPPRTRRAPNRSQLALLDAAILRSIGKAAEQLLQQLRTR
jgi:hypothetical protein